MSPDTTFRYAGVGARATPRSTLRDMTKMAGWLAGRGWHLRTGGADGADTAFADGAGSGPCEIIPGWAGMRGHGPEDSRVRVLRQREAQVCMSAVARFHPTWESCTDAVRRLHGRNAAVVLGPDLDDPVDAVVCWTSGGRVVGGTGIAISVARSRDVPVLNLAEMTPRQVCEKMIEIENRSSER